jgi:hypothetical protein
MNQPKKIHGGKRIGSGRKADPNSLSSQKPLSLRAYSKKDFIAISKAEKISQPKLFDKMVQNYIESNKIDIKTL